MGKRPYFPFYVGDWFKDPGVRALSLEAKGLWIDMLCLMHESDRRGYLQLGGKAITQDQLARMTGCSSDRIPVLLQELKTSGVCSCTDDSVIYSRRMVADDAKTRACSDAGRKGGGNPHLRATFIGHPKGDPKGTPKGIPKHPFEYEYEDGSVSSPEGGVGGTAPAPPGQMRPEFNPLYEGPFAIGHWRDGAEQCWKAYPKKVGEQRAKVAFAGALQGLSEGGCDDPIAYLRGRIVAYAEACKRANRLVLDPLNFVERRAWEDDYATYGGEEPKVRKSAAQIVEEASQ